MPARQDLRATGDRIEQLLDELQATADPRTCGRAEELLRLVSELYGAGLARIVELAGERGPRAWSTPLVADDLVASLLLVHGLHPEALARRVEGALARVRPLLAAHGGDVELLEVDADGGRGHRSPARQLRRLPVLGGHPAGGRGAGHRRGRARGRPHRRRPSPPGRAPRSRWPSAAKPGYDECPSRDGGRCVSDTVRLGPAATRWPCCPASARSAPRRPSRGALRAVRRGRSPTTTAIWSTSRPATCCAPAGLLPAVHLGGRRRRATSGPCPTATWRCRRFELSARRSGRRLQIPVGVAFFFFNSVARPGGRLLPRPGRGHRVGAAPRHLGRAGRPPTRCSATLSPTSRPSSSGAGATTRRHRVLRGADRRLLRAGRPPAPAVAGLRRRARGPTAELDTFLRRTSEARAR